MGKMRMPTKNLFHCLGLGPCYEQSAVMDTQKMWVDICVCVRAHARITSDE